MRAAGLQLARASSRRFALSAPALQLHHQLQLLLQPAAVFSSAPSSRSPRARRLRRAKAAQSKASGAAKPTNLLNSIDLLASIDEISQNGLTQRVEMPEELLERITAIVRARSHSQLEMLREKLRAVGDAAARGIPLDMHTRPLGWTLDKTQQIKAFAYGPSETLAYLAFEVEDAYATAHNVMRELKRRLPSFKPRSMLDFGAGPGTASWVAHELFGESLDSYRIVEPSQSMVDAASTILEDFPGLSVRRSIADLAREIDAAGKKEDAIQYDLIAANFVLSDLTSDFERVAVTSALWELLAEGGCLVLVDDGNPWGSHQVRSARQFVLDTVNEQEGGNDDDEADEHQATSSERVRIVAPCPHQHECPAIGGTWCHFVQRAPKVQYPRVATTKRWHGQKGAKFSYVILQKQAGTAKLKNDGQLARLVRSPLLATRHVHLDLCTPEGNLERRSVTKGKAIREVYRASRKAHWGASWPADASIYKDTKSK